MWHGPMEIPHMSMQPWGLGWWMTLIIAFGIIAFVTVIVTRNMLGADSNAPNE